MSWNERRRNLNAGDLTYREKTCAKPRDFCSAGGERRRRSNLAQRLWQRWRQLAHAVSRDEYEVMLAMQGGECLTCKRHSEDPLVVDRCGATGKPRGLLCRRCKAALPWFNDDHGLLLRAIAYLEKGPIEDLP